MTHARQLSFDPSIQHGRATALADAGGQLAAAARAAIACILLSVAAPVVAQDSAAKCAIAFSANDAMTEIITREGFSFDGYDQLCRALRTQGLQLYISSDTGVLTERAYGWVRVVLERKTTGVQGSSARLTTMMNRGVNSPAAERALYDALSDALAHIAGRADEYVASVTAQETRLRRALAAK